MTFKVISTIANFSKCNVSYTVDEIPKQRCFVIVILYV